MVAFMGDDFYFDSKVSFRVISYDVTTNTRGLEKIKEHCLTKLRNLPLKYCK